ncbi:HEPN domain-containing protein [Hahella sp. CCB-MM4]|uniref:HEPN domain-containing protein n=1 Tax=Hahella sp. (strain CCB-MM4) TaxID=1926491 RepID=UPI001140834F|nr:HEPN domain-containing protein [Hahella sp. CCB-MM4]
MNIQQAKNSSRSFHLAFLRAMEPRSASQDKIEMLVVPGIVCAAFSIELGVKALLMEGKKEARGHELYELFSRLAPAEQAELIEMVGATNDDFVRELKSVANAFVKWRYVYEAGESVSANLDFLRQLSEAVQCQLLLK